MLKYLAILAVVLAVSAVDMVGQQKASAQQHTKTTQADMPPAITENNYDNSKHEQEKTSDVPRWWPEGITAVVIILTMFVIAGQTYYTRRAAEAALLNAQAVIVAERPWMIVDLVTPTDIAGIHPIYDISCFNRGQTPARITDCRMGHRFIDDPERLTLTASDYHPVVMPFPTLKASDKGFRATRVIPGEIWKERSQEDKFIMFFGYTLYEDVFPTEENGGFGKHETHWCFAYSPDLVDPLTPSGPDRYTKNT
jgi:hypothetical protein